MSSATPEDHIRLHLLAAEQLALAVEHNREAAHCYETGKLEKARFHAYIAEGHYIDAAPLAERLSGLTTTLMMLRLKSLPAVGAAEQTARANEPTLASGVRVSPTRPPV